MSSLHLGYDPVSRFAQQVGTLFFVTAFLVGVVYAALPRNAVAFKRMSQLPLENDESEDV